MERKSVSSSNIGAIGYEADTQTLEVEFLNGSIYQYAGVSVEEHEAMMNCDSKGKYLNTNIKGRYSCIKL